MPIRFVAVWLACFLNASLVFAQTQEFVPVTLPKMGDVIGPLVLQSVERTNGWIGVSWDPKATPSVRRIGDKAPTTADEHPWLSIQLDFIGAQFSSDPIENDSFRQQYNEGIKTLLANHRTFWFQVSNMKYAGPGQIGGLFLLDEENGSTIQEDMIRCGYAITSSRQPHENFYAYGDDYRDKLLRLEGEARAYHLGIWAPHVDPTTLPLDQALARLEQVAQDTGQPRNVREKTIQQLFKVGDQNKYLDLTINFASAVTQPIKRAEVFRYCAQACRLSELSEENKKKYLLYAYGLLEKINDGHGSGSFLASDIGTCIGIKPLNNMVRPFDPDSKLPQYRDKLGNFTENYAQDTVNNALDWWHDHKAQYQ